MFHRLLISFGKKLGWNCVTRRKRRTTDALGNVQSSVSIEILEDRRLLVANGIEISSEMTENGSGLETGDNPSHNDYSQESDSTNTGGEATRQSRRRGAQLVPRILNGSFQVDQEFASVGIVGNRRNPGGFGTGTLIDSEWVLTAGHVSRGVAAKRGRFVLEGITYETVRIFKHPQFHYPRLGTDNANDIALWKLGTPVLGVAPSPIDRSTPQVGDNLTLVGYGSGGTEFGELGDFGNKRQGSTPIDQVSRTLISWDFDHPNESNTGHGDSGGPGFILRDGVEYVAGVTSGGEKENASLGDHSYDTRVEAYTDWIDEIIAQGGRRVRTASATSRQQKLLESAELPASKANVSRSVVPRIINGNPIPETTFPAVGKASSFLGPCTATLISPQWVLTAGHCTKGIGDTDGVFEVDGVVYNTTKVIIHPKYNSSKLGTNAGNDLALWKLDRPVVGITPSPLLRTAPKVGVNLTLVGYGYGGDANGATGTYGTKRVGQTRMDGRTGKLIRWNFDSPTESNTAAGDSGGPAYVLVNGVYHLAGVTSGGKKSNSALGDVAADTRVDSYAKWIDKTISQNL